MNQPNEVATNLRSSVTLLSIYLRTEEDQLGLETSSVIPIGNLRATTGVRQQSSKAGDRRGHG